MSMASQSQQRSASRHNALPSTSSKGKQRDIDTTLQPCAATSSLFLYADGPTIVCLRHDSLAVERRFQKHQENIQIICVDNASERGAGRFVVTYDVGKTAIVWDLFTGELISRFASYEPLTVAAWMRNGTLVFGNEKGEVIFFEPSTSEHVSARTIFDPITAIAPAADCRTYAIGYRNGSILLANLEPNFVILHTLTNTRGPSPVAGVLWHASSSKQRSDMLASHTVEGDLRVWSIAKAPSTTPPKVIRSLKRSESDDYSRQWISWSKNGRIIQFANNQTLAWDVRTKDVTFQGIPTADFVRSIAVYGPTGTLFTVSMDHTVQQVNVETAQLVASMRHSPGGVPQTPPMQQDFTQLQSSESEGEVASPRGQTRLDAYAAEAATIERNRSGTPRSNHVREESYGSPRRYEVASPTAKTTRTTTTMSFGVQSAIPRDLYSPISTKSDRKTSRLRQEIIRSPEERPIPELFPFARARLSDMPYRQPRAVDETSMGPEALRQQMLSVVFGWDNDINSLIMDELRRLPSDNAHAVFLSKWLDSSPEEVAEAISSSAPNNALDWIRLALSSVSESQNAKQIAHVFVEKLLTNGDVHAAVAVLLASGDHDDAIEVYVSRNHYLDAVLLTCLLMPTDWQRQSFLVRKWGEHAVQVDPNLAIRCFSCAGVESTEAWTSPRAQTATTVTSPVAPTLQPNVYHKIMERRGLQDTTSPVGISAPPMPVRSSSTGDVQDPLSASSLKLVTTFSNKDQYKFPGLMSSDGTPINQVFATPIADSAAPRSALSPVGTGSYKSSNMRSLNSVVASRTGTPSSNRHRLPSIGETPVDVDLHADVPQMPRPLNTRAPPTPADSGSDKERDAVKQMPMDNQRMREEMPLLLTPAVYEPPEIPRGQTPQTAIATRSTTYFDETPERTNSGQSGKRAGSRSRKPDGLSIRMFPVTEEIQQDNLISASNYSNSIGAPSTSGSGLMHFDIGDLASPPHTGNSYSSYRSAQSPSVTGRSIDQYISSLEQAQYYKGRPRGNSASSKQSKDEHSTRRKQSREQIDGRGRGETRNIPAPKRSPSSPVPMNSEELRLYSASVESFDSAYLSTMSAAQKSQSTLYGPDRDQETPVNELRERQRSRSRQADGRTRNGSRARSRRPSPERNNSYRGRSKSRRDDSYDQSPSSPEPMLPSEEDLTSSSVDPALRFVAQNRTRLNSDNGRRRDRSESKRRQPSPDRKSSRLRSRSRQPEPIDISATRKSSVGGGYDLSRRRAESSVDLRRGAREQEQMAYDDEMKPQSSRPDYERPKTSNSNHVSKSLRTRELAQAELEARRLSLARRPSAPAVPFPGQVTAHNKSNSADQMPPLYRSQTDTGIMMRQTKSPQPLSFDVGALARSRPTTPATMKSIQQHSANHQPELPTGGELLSSTVYQPPKVHEGWPATPSLYNADSYIKVDVPQDMPKHRYYDSSIGSSRNATYQPARNASRERNMSRERRNDISQDIMVVTLGEDEDDVFVPVSYGPPIVPELQHLAMPPPPPPPPPAPPKSMTPIGGLRLQTSDLVNPAHIPLPASAYPGEPLSANPSNHRRGKSGNDSQLVGKIRGFAGRMRSESRGRSSSRPRDNPTRSPMTEDISPPYETLIQAQQAHQQLATVIEGR